VGFANTAGSGQQQVFVALDEGTTGQILDKGPIDPRRSGEIKAGQGFEFITAGEFEPASQTLLTAAFQFVIEQQGQKLGRTELAFESLLGPGIEGQDHAAEFELAQFRQQGMG